MAIISHSEALGKKWPWPWPWINGDQKQTWVTRVVTNTKSCFVLSNFLVHLFLPKHSEYLRLHVIIIIIMYSRCARVRVPSTVMYAWVSCNVIKPSSLIMSLVEYLLCLIIKFISIPIFSSLYQLSKFIYLLIFKIFMCTYVSAHTHIFFFFWSEILKYGKVWESFKTA